MKTTDPRDPLDRKIDDLLANHPITPSDDFAARVLAAATAEQQPASTRKTSPMANKLLRFALPLAAVIAVALTLTPLSQTEPPTATATEATSVTEATTLTTTDMQEIFQLEEGLTALSQLQNDGFDNNDDLLNTLDALYFEI